MLKGINLGFHYPNGPWLFRGYDLEIHPGEIVGLAGPSGQGKSTLGMVLSGFLCPTEGSISVDGAPLPQRGPTPVQLLFQHPELAVNPRWTIKAILHEAFSPPSQLLERLAISRDWFSRYPHELSGGELQRVCLARALYPQVRYLICDEMTSMLDPLTQAHIWEKLLEITRERNLGLLVISHESALLGRLCHRMLPALGEPK
jgi:ABC-type dipeptide/oligopeptide/nickel transport system ATPase subunit